MSLPISRIKSAWTPKKEEAPSHQIIFWRGYGNQVVIKDYLPITSIHFSKVKPYHFCITSGAKAQIFSSQTCTNQETFSKFRETVLTATVRDDGQLLLTGDEGGGIQVFTLESKKTLQSYKQSLAVRDVQWSCVNKVNFVSCGDDRAVHLWELSSNEALQSFKEHDDYVRACSFTQDGLILSGAYDGLVKIWDPRGPTSIAAFAHESPVEDILCHKGVVISAGADLRVWDITAGKRLHRLKPHQKTITSLCSNGTETQVISAGLDGLIRVYDEEWNVVYGTKYKTPILAMAISPDDRHFLVSDTTGHLYIKSREVVKTKQVEKDAPPKKFTEEFFVPKVVYQKSTYYDRLLAQFKYGLALTSIMERRRRPKEIISLLMELQHRAALRQALSDRDSFTLLRLIRFIRRKISRAEWVQILVDVSLIIIDIYGGALGDGKEMRQLKKVTKKQIQRAKEAQRLIGMLGRYQENAS